MGQEDPDAQRRRATSPGSPTRAHPHLKPKARSIGPVDRGRGGRPGFPLGGLAGLWDACIVFRPVSGLGFGSDFGSDSGFDFGWTLV
jgi:hypothetical protein